MKRYLVFVIFLMFAFIPDSCKKDKIFACGVDSPQENLLWLKNMIRDLFCQDVFKYSYAGVEYIVISDCEGSSDISELVYECNGNMICHHGGMYPGSGGCSLPSSFWDSYNTKKVLICKVRRTPN